MSPHDPELVQMVAHRLGTTHQKYAVGVHDHEPLWSMARAVLDLLEAAGRLREPGSCGHSVLGAHMTGIPAPKLVCTLPAGHGGWHADTNGTTWTVPQESTR